MRTNQKGIFPTVYARQLMVSRALTTMVVTPPSTHWSDLWLACSVISGSAISRDQSLSSPAGLSASREGRMW